MCAKRRTEMCRKRPPAASLCQFWRLIEGYVESAVRLNGCHLLLVTSPQESLSFSEPAQKWITLFWVSLQYYAAMLIGSGRLNNLLLRGKKREEKALSHQAAFTRLLMLVYCSEELFCTSENACWRFGFEGLQEGSRFRSSPFFHQELKR